MSRIEQLIEELCPKGVEYKELGEICNIFIGSFIKKTQHNDSFEYPVYNGGIQPTGYFNSFNSNKDSVVLSARGANCGFVNYLTVDFWAGNSCYVIKELSGKVNSKYLFHFLKCNEINLYSLRQTSGIPAINSAPLSKFSIPLPPLPIQQEIVTILDTFTALDASLQAELEARRKQYDHYRNQLLNFEGKEVEWKTLGETGKFIRGKRFVKSDIVLEGVPCIHYGEMYTYYRTWTKKTKSFLDPEKVERLRFAKPGDVIIVTAGETIEDIGNAVAWLGETNVVIHDACFAYSHKFNPKFVSYYFQTDLFRSQIRKHISSSKISAILESGLRQAKIPIPPLSEQERIVSILDKFDALVNTDLPAEIAARRKQYEYYREKLLDLKQNNGIYM